MTCLKSAATCVAMVAFSPAFAGSVMEVVTTEYHDEPPVIGTVEISAQDGVSRMEVTSVSSDESGGMIFREKSRELMKQHLPAQAEAAEPMTVRKTGTTDTINGFRCQYYEVQQQGAKIRELCVTDWDDIDGGREAADSMLGMAGFFDKMAEQFSSGSGMDVMAQQRELFQHMRELGGYPVLTREFDDSGRVESESRLKSARSSDIDPALFSPPQGYRKKDLGL
jgi:hypothetical protein